MKRLHRPDMWAWSRFDEARNLDFHSVLLVSAEGNVAIDPLPLGAHDEKHLLSLGRTKLVVVTNSDHVRGAARLIELTGARLLGPSGERDKFPLHCDGWLADGDEPTPGVRVLEMAGSKTPGELALIIAGAPPTIITGDLVRGPRGGALDLLPDDKLRDRARALASVRRLAEIDGVEAVLVGDGWPVFRDGRAVLRELVARSGG